MSFSELVQLQLEDFWLLQLSASSIFFGSCCLEALLSRPRPPVRPAPELVADMCYWLLSPSLRAVSRLLLLSALAGLALIIGLRVGPGLFDGFGPVARQPRVLIAVELLFLMDLVSYWSHRLFHTVPALWRFHAIHHSAKTVRWSTTGRVHPVNEVFTYLVSTVPFFMVGFPISAVLPLLPAIMFYALAAHAQWNVSYGLLGQLFASPRFHRWHHTHSHEGGNSNFGNVFSIWDRVFGTRYYPEDRLPQVFGLDHDDMPESYLGQLLYPFRPAGAAQPEPSSAPAPTPSNAPAPARRSTAPQTRASA